MSIEYENKLILVEKHENHVAVVTLNNPPMNLNSIASMEELREDFRKLEHDKDVRVIILTGSGTRAFNAGSDISGFKDMHGNFQGLKFKMELDMMNMIEFISKPTICAIEGYCMGGGLELALCCDLRVVSESAKFSQPEIKLGLYPAGGGLYRLPKIVGISKAYEIMYLGDTFDAQEAYRLNLANKIAPVGTTVEAAMELAERIAQMPSNALAVIKKGAREMSLKESRDCYYRNLDYIDEIFDHENGIEGVSAFLEKRKAHFKFD